MGSGEWTTLSLKREIYERLLKFRNDLSDKKGKHVGFSEAVDELLKLAGY